MPLATFLCPELRRFPPQQRRARLREALRAPLDVAELLALALALIAAALAARATPAAGFIVAAALLVPIGLRHLRRALRERKAAWPR